MAITDIFSRRYEGVQLLDTWGKRETALMVQSVAMMREILWSGKNYEKVDEDTDRIYRSIHDKVAIEIGVEHLSAPTYVNNLRTYRYSYPQIIRAYMLQVPQGGDSLEDFLNDRISVIEQAFKYGYDYVQQRNAALDVEIAKALEKDETRGSPYVSRAPVPPVSRGGSPTRSRQDWGAQIERATAKLTTYHRDRVKDENKALNERFAVASEELNERLGIAGLPLHFHNGLFQLRGDELVEEEVYEYFWELVSHSMWRSVDEQMKEAFDRRDADDRTAPFHAVSALESVIKIISGHLKANTGNEKGASHYIDNLISERSGRFIAAWEGDMLKGMFRNIRNPFGHGPGEHELPRLSPQQADWAIDSALVWSKSLIERI
ncbi:AbiJ-NTD4 domain-containing protein [Novosphingobium sp. JCM 18896]|uniref:AbiJ-NTD4 domain-containing protein n=1 Tax=Novosphingobium sp. JCM 18896 TaxID=2989731 RepID=UPI0022235437|nr:hypothetical protein [Novosphingobium sp. JCM 18896]MCW1431344.1 hypothetical protein [Novosphingobium sp. JCM 18896]